MLKISITAGKIFAQLICLISALMKQARARCSMHIVVHCVSLRLLLSDIFSWISFERRWLRLLFVYIVLRPFT